MALPLVLAGPIVRRVTARSVSVWIALSEEADITLSLWDKAISGGTAPGQLVTPEAAMKTAKHRTVRIGGKLYVSVVTIDFPAPAAPLLPSTLYSYNISISANASGSADLKSLKLLEDTYGDATNPAPHLALGYQPGLLPTFVLPPVTIERLNLAHGSCRKPHGFGNDSLAALDSMIRDAVLDGDPDKRPHQLFLTGDQIYADEVPTVLIAAINALGATLLGQKENLKARKADNTVQTYEATMAKFPATRRQRILQRNARFTSEAAANHLMAFGEFAATYLMYWNVAVWPNELFAATDVLKARDITAIWDTDPLTPEEQDLAPQADEDAKEFALPAATRIAQRKEALREGYRQEVDDVVRFRLQLPNVRRALANIPVYMIMDDHEVTDDWYLSKDWREKVLSSELGVNILRNALMAYAIFQDWGNVPAAYAVAPNNTLLTEIAKVFPAGAASGPNAAAADAIDVLFGFNLHDETSPPVTWHYTVPTSETTVYVLDTRTRRTYETRYSPPGLLSDAALDAQIPAAAQPGPCQIFISPAPVLGLALLEELIQPAITAFNAFNADPEAWALSPVAFEKFLARLQKFGKVILLSGDVHFALAASMDYWKKDAPQPARFVQFVSSAAKNQKLDQELFLASGFIQKLVTSVFYPAERVGFTSRAGLTATNPANKKNPPGHRIRLRREPVLLSVEGWPEGTTLNKPADWSWRVSLAQDERPDDTSAGGRPEKVQLTPISPDVNPASGDVHAAYRKVLARHMEVFAKGAERRVMWDTNVGIIRFKRDGEGKLTVIQDLLSWFRGDETSDDPDAYLSFAVSLEPTTQQAPAIA